MGWGFMRCKGTKAGDAHRSAGLLKRSERVLMSFTMAALLMSVAAAACHLRKQQLLAIVSCPQPAVY